MYGRYEKLFYFHYLSKLEYCLSLDSTNHLPCKDMLSIVVLQLLIQSVYEQLFQTIILEAFKTK